MSDVSKVSEDSALAVLVVDDDEVDREAVRRALRGQPFEFHEAASGAEALAALRTDALVSPRLVLLDINMPGMDGFGFLDALRAEPAIAETVVFMLTSSSREADAREAYRRGVAGYLVKSDLGPKMIHLSALLSAYSAAVRFPA